MHERADWLLIETREKTEYMGTTFRPDGSLSSSFDNSPCSKHMTIIDQTKGRKR